tara:strand:- start:264 stop:464 length:201 start_codon:yes stop_codon:yes gene_type:complete
MNHLLKKLLNIFNTNTVNIPSIKELKELNVLRRKNEISKDFRKYVLDLNMKQNKWLSNNYKKYNKI